MGRHPLPKASRTCWKAFVFYFMERLVGGISRSDSWGILVFLDFSVIWAPHHQGGGSTSSPNPVIFQKIKKCVILKTWKTKSGYCSKSNLEYARTLVLKGESRREQERAGESRREEERAGERRREKEIVRKKALLIHHHVRILPTQSQSGIRRSTRNGTVHETPPTNFSNKWRTRALPSYCNWFCMKSRARVSVLAKNSIYDIKIFDPQKSQNSWLSRSAPGSWYNLEFDQNLSPDGSIASREIIF